MRPMTKGARPHARPIPAAFMLALLTLAACLAIPRASAADASPPRVLDDFSDIGAWVVAPSSGVEMSLSQVEGPSGPALRVDYDFARGSGFAVIRRVIDVELPSNYAFSYTLWGKVLPNTLEFKLFDQSNDNVWWVNKPEFAWPTEPTSIEHRARHFRFAWGPSGGAPLARVHAIELAITAGRGGKGHLIIDDLAFRPLPPPPATIPQPTWRELDPALMVPTTPAAPLPDEGMLGTGAAAAGSTRAVEIDLGVTRDLGGVFIGGRAPSDAVLHVSLRDRDGAWRPVPRQPSLTARPYASISLPDAEASAVRVVAAGEATSATAPFDTVQILAPDFPDKPNNLIFDLAERSPRGAFPRWASNERVNWTVVGASGDDNEALVSEHGQVEAFRKSFSLEPFLLQGERALGWADASSHTCTLLDGYLPIASVERTTSLGALQVTSFVAGEAGASTLYVRYRFEPGPARTGTNTATSTHQLKLAVALRPLQVLPPWHELNITGGVGPIGRVSVSTDRFTVDSMGETRTVHRLTAARVASPALDPALPWRPSTELAAAASAAQGADPDGLAGAVAIYELDPAAPGDVWLAVPLHPGAPVASSPAQAEALLEATADLWRERLNRVRISLPASAQRYWDTARSTLAYTLINRDGPAIQPGSRSYERTWIRDGSLTSTALQYFGFDQEVEEFIDWFAPFQYADGKVPCCVDSRGPDPVPEHDSHGQYIYAVREHHRFTLDDEFVRRHWPRVVKAVDYIEFLRNQRLGSPYTDGPPEERAKLGLVPQSISHEGYSAKPMHSYWDCFFVLKGLADAAELASIVGDQTQLARITKLHNEFERSLFDSMRLVAQTKNIDYVPGCVELGDFDATSTAVGVFPCGALGKAPEPNFSNTFERYWAFFRDRRDGVKPWKDYTPYEMRLCTSMIMLGHPERVHEMLDWFFGHQLPQGWNSWGEIVWHDGLAPRFIGDMPHTWIASDFVKAFRSMLVYERRGALVIGAGIPGNWPAEGPGVSVHGLPTYFGDIGFELRRQGNADAFRFSARPPAPPEGFVIMAPGRREVRSVRGIDPALCTINGAEVRLAALPESIELVYE